MTDMRPFYGLLVAQIWKTGVVHPNAIILHSIWTGFGPELKLMWLRFGPVLLYLVYSWLTLVLPLAYLWPKSGKQDLSGPQEFC